MPRVGDLGRAAHAVFPETVAQEPVDETLHRLQHVEAQAGQERFREG